MKRERSFTLNLWIFKLSRIIFLLLGLAPYKVHIEVPQTSTKWTLEFANSTLGGAYNILFLLVFLTIFIIFAPKMTESNYLNEFSGTKFEIILSIIGNSVSIITILICTIYQQNMVNIGNHLNDFHDKFINKLLINNEINKNNLFKTYEYSIIVIPFSLIIIGLSINHAIIYKPLSILFFIINGVILVCFIMQYTLIIRIVKGIVEEINSAFGRMDAGPILYQENSVFRVNARNSGFVVPNLIIIRRARNIIYKLSNEISDFHALPSLLIIFYFCCILVYNVYFCINYFIDEQHSWNMVFINCLLWGIFVVYPIVILSESVKRFNSEVIFNP